MWCEFLLATAATITISGRPFPFTVPLFRPLFGPPHGSLINSSARRYVVIGLNKGLIVKGEEGLIVMVAAMKYPR